MKAMFKNVKYVLIMWLCSYGIASLAYLPFAPVNLEAFQDRIGKHPTCVCSHLEVFKEDQHNENLFLVKHYLITIVKPHISQTVLMDPKFQASVWNLQKIVSKWAEASTVNARRIANHLRDFLLQDLAKAAAHVDRIYAISQKR